MRTFLSVTLLLTAVSARTALAQHAHDPRHHAGPDSGFAAMQARGKTAMGVDQYRSTHAFDTLPDGGRIALTSDSADAAAVTAIRAHFAQIATAFAAGDFSTPAFVHDEPVPGTEVMKALAGKIRYRIREIPRGAELLISTGDAAARAAIHQFLAFQRAEHRVGPVEP